MVETISRGQTQERRIEALQERLVQAVQLVDSLQGTQLATQLKEELAQSRKQAGQTAGGSVRKRTGDSVERMRERTRQAARPR